MSRSAKISIPARERKDLDASLYSSIDSFLKPLKTTTRRLQVVSTTLANEEQLLQRIYYKGKNQHRSALFWRRTTEIRRYAERAKVLNLSNLLQRLRCSFFGGEALSNQSLLKGAWNRYPEPRALDAVLSRVVEARTLFVKFQERTTDAYSSFTVSMQSGAFIQILLVLAAVSARMNAIAQEHLEIIDGLIQAIQSLKNGITATEPSTAMEASQLTPHVESAGPLEPNRNAFSGLASSFAAQNPGKFVEKASLPSGNAPNRPDVAKVATREGRSKSSTPAVGPTKSKTVTPVPRTSSKPRSSTTAAVPSNLSSKTAKRPSKDKEKKKRKKDEIDDIFGF